MNHDPLDQEDPIEEVASNWLTQRAEGFSSAQRREFEHWCRADPRHAAAVVHLEAACALLEKMPLVRGELQPVVEFPAEARVTRQAISPRRTFLSAMLVAGLAAAVALMAVGGWQWDRKQPKPVVYATSAGGYQRVVLTDGSVVELNAKTEVCVDLAPRERRVALMTGEAHFTVAHDTARPFIVAAGGVAVRAVGTAFNVRLGPSAVEVLVTEGKVSVSEATGQSANDRENRNGTPTGGDAMLLSANERALIAITPLKATTAPTKPIVEKIAPEVIREALLWQERKLVFTDTPLREVVVQFNRRNRLQLEIGDAAVAERPVGGTFAADNVEGFIRLLEDSGAIVVERRGETTVVLRTAR